MQVRIIDSDCNIFLGQESQHITNFKLSYAQTSAMSDPFSYSAIVNLNIRILDFSPEWDYTSGGTKMII